ncbi:MAG: CvpA family protein [Tannerella sp.]|jgi:membrane protein required for colicin V production|nr:CvpA family protein [Tannerella sp.]
MNWLDIAIMCLTVVGFIKGYSDGFIRQIATLIALVAAIWFCSKIAVFLREYILQTGWFPEHSITIISYIIAFILITGAVTLAGGIIHKVLDVTPLNLLNRMAGGVFAVMAIVVILSLTFNFLEELDPHSAVIPREIKIESQLYLYVKDRVPAVYPDNLFIWRE